MEIDFFPMPSTKGIHRYIGMSFLGLIIITYVVSAYMIAQKLIGEDNVLLCFLATIPIFIGEYAVFVLLLHGIKQCLYAYFKSNRRELNNQADRENMDSFIVKHLEDIQKKLNKAQIISNPQYNVAPPVHTSPQEHSEEYTCKDGLQPSIMPKLDQALKMAQSNLAPFIKQLHIDRIQLEKRKQGKTMRNLKKS